MSEPPARERLTRSDAPLWRQAVDGIGIVIAFAAIVSLVGGTLALVVSLFF